MKSDTCSMTTSGEMDVTIHRLFERTAAANPNAVALRDGSTAISFAELDRRAAATASVLKSHGVEAGSVVGVFLDRSADFVACVLAILKAGGVYLPLDLTLSENRLRFMVHDAGAQVVLTSRSMSGAAQRLGNMEVVCVDDRTWRLDGESAAKAPRFGAPCGVTRGSPAYVIYTSGSTGKPKGVIGTHAGLVNRIRAQADFAPFDRDDVCCLKTPIGFVDALFEVLAPVCLGIPLVIASNQVGRDPSQICRLIERESITRLVTVPSFARQILMVKEASRRLASLRWWTLSGEALDADLATLIAESRPGVRILNLYGSSEVAADATYHVVGDPRQTPIPIGRPIRNMRAYVLGAERELLPRGEEGEIYIAGVGLALGYTGDPGLTEERFVSDPFCAGERMYRTGDMGRWTSDGELEFRGRLDHQVKIRGSRVEFGEVEAALCELDPVRSAVVDTYEEETGDRLLVAYVIRSEKSLNEQVCRRLLRQSLPEYAIPTSIVFVEEFTYTPSGKIDRLALQHAAPRRGANSPHGDDIGRVDAFIGKIWAEVFGGISPGMDDNFFDLGGNSLMMMRISNRLAEWLGEEIPLVELFENQTIRTLAAYVERQVADGELPRPDLQPDGMRLAGSA